MTPITVPDTARRAVDLPGPSDTDRWTTGMVNTIAGVPQTAADLVDTYGTADPKVLRAGFALADDVALAERLAASQVAA